MKSYYKVINNKWGDDCPCFALDELDRAIEFAQDCQSYCNEYNTLDHDDVTPFKVMLLKITSEIISF